MKCLIPMLVFVCMGFDVLCATADSDKKPGLNQFELPDDPKAAVIVLDYRGGRLRRKTDDPVLTILANGSLRIANPWGMSREVKSQLSPAELQELLSEIITENRFFEADSDGIKTAVLEAARAKGRIGRILDSSTVSIRVRVNGKEQEVSYYALSFFAKRHPEVAELQRLNAVNKRLDRLMSFIRAGGRKGATEYLQQANQELKKKFPKESPFTLDDLRYCNMYANGTTKLQFYRGVPDDTGKVVSYASASITVSAEGQLEVAVASN